MDYQQMYHQKLCTADEAAQLIENNDYIYTAVGACQPWQILNALAKRKEELNGVSVLTTLDTYPSEIYKLGDTEHIHLDAGFAGPNVRKGIKEGYITVSPTFLSEAGPALVKYRKNDVIIAMVSTMDKNGYFSTGLSLTYMLDLIMNTKKIIIEVNKNMPRVHGRGWIHVSNVAAIVENPFPVAPLPDIPVSKDDEAIGKAVADLIPDGAAVQIGVGDTANGVAKFLSDKNDLGVHSEVYVDTLFRLQEKGVITNRKKKYMRYISVANFAIGSQEMYEWMDDNPSVQILPAEEINDPNIISLNDNMIAVNQILSIDLTGQVCSEAIGPVQYSGVGGQVDFVRGALRSKGGKSFFTVHSTAKNGEISSITSQLLPGSVVTTPRTETAYVVTEYGVAHLWGRNIRDKAKSLIAIAHPNHREKLTFEAKKLGYL